MVRVELSFFNRMSNLDRLAKGEGEQGKQQRTDQSLGLETLLHIQLALYRTWAADS